MKKIYGPDIHKRGTSIVTIYTEKQKEGVFTEEKEEKILMEYHTDNHIYANIYFDAITNVINDIGGIHSTRRGLKWRLSSTKPLPKQEPFGNIITRPKPKHPWSHIMRSEFMQCPIKYKKDLIVYVAKAMKWTKKKARAKGKAELKQIWAYKNLKHIKKRLSE